MGTTTINEIEKISLKELEELKKGEEFSSKEVDQILFLRDLFAKNGIIIDDLDVFLNILKGLKSGKNLI